MTSLLRVNDLRTQFDVGGRIVHAVDGVTLEVARGETVGIVGESGSGKSMTALSVLRLVPEPGRITGGEIWFGQPGSERNVLEMNGDEIRSLRGQEIAMIFQDPMTSLNPVLRVGRQIEEAMNAHRFTHEQARDRVRPLLDRVKIPAAGERAREYPHQFSGGMRQRAMIAMGLSNDPSLLIADEPTTALDVTVQAQIIELLRELNREQGMAIVLITHNLAVVASLCTRIIVMYAGRIVEEGPTRAIFQRPQHPYTWSLLRSIPRVDERRQDKLQSISGLPPDMTSLPQGCTFHPRCPFREDRCVREEPPLEDVEEGGHAARCWVLMRNVAAPDEAAT
ncbi:MAG: ABC transporter ATP-binding protein [bacterium]|jgi:oligopeptide/dipeptide ABC transporter ATP-binding protein|nr:ABC transporter ATP-binding protein [bacterium]